MRTTTSSRADFCSLPDERRTHSRRRDVAERCANLLGPAALDQIFQRQDLQSIEAVLFQSNNPASLHEARAGARVLIRFDEHAPVLCCVTELAMRSQPTVMPTDLVDLCETRGWMLGACPQDSTAAIRLRNHRFLWSFRVPATCEHRQLKQDIFDQFYEGEALSLATVLDRTRCEGDGLTKLEATWWSMVATRVLRCDLSSPLTSETTCVLCPRLQHLSEETLRSLSVRLLARFPKAADDPSRWRTPIESCRGACDLSWDASTVSVRPSEWIATDHLPSLPVPTRWDPTDSNGKLLPVSTLSLQGLTLKPDFTCTLQRDLVSLITFDTGHAFEVPNFTIPYVDSNGRSSQFTPELIFHRGEHPLLCCVPNPAHPQTCQDLDLKRAAVEAYCATRDWDFDIFDAIRIRTDRLKNVQFLWSWWGRNDIGILVYVARILHRFYHLENGTKAQILEGVVDCPSNEALAEAAFWTLVADKVLLCDLDRLIDDETAFSLAESEVRRLYRVTPPYPHFLSTDEVRALERWTLERRRRWRLADDVQT